MFMGHKCFTNISCLFLGESPKSAGTHQAIEDKVFSLVTASMQSYSPYTNTCTSCLFLGERPKSAGTHRAIEDKVFSLVTASMQSDDEDSGKYHRSC